MEHSLVDQLINALPLIAMMLATGIAGGILAGLLGVGGGIVIVPVLEIALEIIGIDPAIRMHIAVATSLSTIVLTSISSARAHHKRGTLDLGIVRYWAIPVFMGSIAGVLLASRASSGTLAAIFGLVALIVTIKMMLPLEGKYLWPKVPKGILGPVIPVGVGLLSSMMGIGGGTLSVPVLTLLNQPIHRAVSTASLFGLLISVPATIGYIIVGWSAPGLPFGNLGYVSLIGFATIAPATWIAAPWGAKIAHMLKPRHLTLAFGFFLLIVAVRMLYRSWLSF